MAFSHGPPRRLPRGLQGPRSTGAGEVYVCRRHSNTATGASIPIREASIWPRSWASPRSTSRLSPACRQRRGFDGPGGQAVGYGIISVGAVPDAPLTSRTTDGYYDTRGGHRGTSELGYSRQRRSVPSAHLRDGRSRTPHAARGLRRRLGRLPGLPWPLVTVLHAAVGCLRARSGQAPGGGDPRGRGVRGSARQGARDRGEAVA